MPRARRLAHAYGTDARELLSEAGNAADPGRDFGATLTERDVRWMMDREWVRTADDALWRRSKLGLHMAAAERETLDGWMRARRAAQADG